MQTLKKKILPVSLVLLCSLLLPMVVYAADGAEQTANYGTILALLPPVVAIVLALITKEVYSSLFLGILIGGVLYAGWQPEGIINHVFQDGFVASLTDSYNMGILIFLVLLGMMVALMNNAGGSAAFGKWASEHIKTRVGAQLATILLGVLIFIDDYFNCLTVGSVMRPVTDRHNVSRSKLAYLIDATAAPVCIIAPISSWAAAVSGFVEGEDGLALFVNAIPYNYYAILTIFMMVAMVVMKIEYGPMAVHEANAKQGDLFSMGERAQKMQEMDVNPNGKVIDLVLPIASLIICCIIGMVWTGGIFEGEDFVTAFSNSDASVGLAVGSFFGVIITILFYLKRKVLKFTKCMDCLAEGFKAMVPAILILTMAWTLKGMTDSLGAKEFVAQSMSQVAGGLQMLLPAIIFLVGCFLAFATGTSWGTFGILIPIVVAVFQGTNHELMIISISACMAGAVCGDHCSPISDTTIMASAGAECNHVNHVTTQLPYAIVAAAVSCVAYIIAGLTQNVWVSLVIGIAMMTAVLFLIRYILGKDAKS